MSIQGLLQGVINSAASGGGGGGGGGGPTYRSWTIEWWGKKLSPQTNTVPRVFACGVDTSASIGFSNESGGDYVWTGGAVGAGPISVGSIANSWHHWAIVSNGTQLMFFKDGVSQYTTLRTGNPIADQITNFIIGSDTWHAWKGRITDFHIIKGTAKYTSDFTPPSSRIQPQTGSQILFYANGSTFVDAVNAVPWSTSNCTRSTDDPYNDSFGSIEFNGNNSELVYNAGTAFALDLA